MDRLTFEGNFCDIAMCRDTPGGSFCETGMCSLRKVWERLKAYEDTGLSPEVCANYKTFENEAVSKGVTFNRIVELMKADSDGLLVVLPCKVGTPVWVLAKKCKHAGEENEPWNSCNQYWHNVFTKGMWGCAGRDNEGNTFDCEKKEMVWYAEPMGGGIHSCCTLPILCWAKTFS